MLKNKLIWMDGTIFRILDSTEDNMVLLIDCIKRTMPKWYLSSELSHSKSCTEAELLSETNTILHDMDKLSADGQRFIREHYSMIVGILPYIGDKQTRSHLIAEIAAQKNISKRTVSNYLCLYLAYQDMSVFVPKEQEKDRELTQDEKNMRWSINKYYYTKNKNSLKAAYTFMLKEKYCDGNGVLVEGYPSFNQFKYYFQKHNKLQTQYISRDGLKHYQRNNRPLLGDGQNTFAPLVGTGLLDATICDIYLVDDSGNVVGRPILTACVDAYSGVCLGYHLSWEGGVYSLRGLMLNVIADKKEHCKKHGILIEKDEWDCNMLPGTLVTDKGSEYISENFEQIAELGVEIVNLASYRPELKGRVEKFFDLVQSYYKLNLRGKGVIEPDYMERGSHDYRKDACLSIAQFEKILLYSILYYNNKRIIENFPYDEESYGKGVLPFSHCIYQYKIAQNQCNLISVTAEMLTLTLLPRTTGKFGRTGLKVNKLRYRHDGYTENYLKGGTATVAFNPENTSYVWLIENGDFIKFTLIESRYANKDLSTVREMQSRQKATINSVAEESLQAQIDLANHIQAVAATSSRHNEAELKSIKNIRQTRKQEQARKHRNYAEENGL